MRKTFITLAAALLASPAWSDTLIDHANGMQVDGFGQRGRRVCEPHDAIAAVFVAEHDHIGLRAMKQAERHTGV